MDLKDIAKGVQGMQEASVGIMRARLVQTDALAEASAEYLSPRIETPIPLLNHTLYGGMYGVFVVGGSAGVGKSAFAMLTAVDAAHGGLQVIYFAGEMTEKQLMARLHWLCGKRGYAWEDVHANLHTVLVPKSYSRAQILRWHEVVAAMSDRMLVVWDSFNAIVEAVADAESLNYFAAVHELQSMIETARNWSEGAIASLVVSELNQDGSTKGRSWEYKSDGTVYFKEDKEYLDGRFSVRIMKSRERCEGRRDLGSYFVLAGDTLFPMASDCTYARGADR